MDCGAKTARIVKPYKDRDKIIAQLQEAEAPGEVAVGMDTASFDPSVIHMRNF